MSDEECTLPLEIELPAEEKRRLEAACRREGTSVDDYIEGLVHAALGLQSDPPRPSSNGANPEGSTDA